jgi:ribosome-associated protein
MSATSTRHAQALAQAIAEKFDFPLSKAEGYINGEWVLLDLGDVVVHVFYEPVRLYYALDKIWSHAPSVEIESFEEEIPKRKQVALRAHP